MKTVMYKNREMVLTVAAYSEKTLALSLTELETGEPWTTITICPDTPMSYGVAVIKNYSENEGIYNWLLENRIIHAQIALYRTGYVVCPVVTVNMQTLFELDESGTEHYRRLHRIRTYPFTEFELGKIVITAGAKAHLTEIEVGSALVRHIGNDWGECGADTWEGNNKAVKNGGDLFSVYRTKGGTRFFIKTEWDRSVTTVYLPGED